MERSEYDSMTPTGQAQLWGDLARGAKTNRAGRRRAVHMLVGLAVVLVLGVVLVFLLAWSGLLTDG
jgi:hypothetical protein